MSQAIVGDAVVRFLVERIKLLSPEERQTFHKLLNAEGIGILWPRNLNPALSQSQAQAKAA